MIIIDCKWIELINIDLEDICIQQDCAKTHIVQNKIDSMRKKFTGWDFNWSPRSPGLTPLDYYFWDYVKIQVYKNNQQSIFEVKDEIVSVVKNNLN